MSERRTSLADIARELNTTSATVSMALRNDPRISKRTRRRVHTAARKMGYVPDPEIARLMSHLRTSRTTRIASTLAVLTDAEDAADYFVNPFICMLLQGIREQAEELGHALDFIRVRENRMSPARLQAILETRAIRGALMLPPQDISQPFPLPQEDIVLVAASACVPEFEQVHRVIPDHYANMIALYQAIIAAGYRSIGLVTSPEMEQRARNCPVCVYEWMMRDHARMARIPPYVLNRTSKSLFAWYDKYRPSILVAPEMWLIEALQDHINVPDEVPAALFMGFGTGFAGVNQHSEVIGREAVQLLAAEVVRNVDALPEHPKTILIRGEFVPGASMPVPAPAPPRTRRKV